MSNKVRSSHKVKIEVIARASCNLMLAGFSIFYPGDIQEMIADNKKYLALKPQSSCGNSKEPTCVRHWKEYSHLSNNRGGWNKRVGVQKLQNQLDFFCQFLS